MKYCFCRSRRLPKAGVLTLACALTLSGCGAPLEAPDASPAVSTTVSTALSEPVSSASAERTTIVQTAVFPDGFYASEPENGGTGDPLAPYAACIKYDPRGGDLVEIELSLPGDVTIREAALGEAAYAEGFEGPLNLYRNGEIIGTIGYDWFYQSQLENPGTGDPPAALTPEETYKGVFIFRESWLEGYTPVAHDADYTYCAALSRPGTRGNHSTRGILYYDQSVMRSAAMEVREDAFTEEELSAIAESIRLTRRERPAPAPLPIPVLEVPEGYAETRIPFPAYQDGKRDYNASIYEVTPFELRVSLPEGWTYRLPGEEEREKAAALFTPVELWNGETRVGSVGYTAYEVVGPTLETNYYLMIYNGLMLGSIVNWDNDYTPVTMTETTCTATAKIRVVDTSDASLSAAESPVNYFPAILSYDEKLLVYVGFSFENDALLTEEQLLTMAKSVRLYRPE